MCIRDSYRNPGYITEVNEVGIINIVKCARYPSHLKAVLRTTLRLQVETVSFAVTARFEQSKIKN